MAFNIKRLLLVFVIFIVVILSFIILVLYKGKETEQVISQQKQFQIYQKSYKKLLKKINSKEKVILIGDKQDGLASFLNFYISKSKDLYEIKRRQYDSKITLQYNMAPLMSNIYQLVVTHLPGVLDSSNQTVYWILQNYQQNATEFEAQVLNLINEYPNDKYLIVTSSENLKVPKFKKIQLPQLSQERIHQLFTSLNVNQNIRDNILQFYNNDLQKVFSVLNSEDIQKQFKSQFQQQQAELQSFISNSTVSVKISNILYNLCLNGLHKQKKSIKQFSNANGIISYKDKTYYWAKRQYVYAYSIFIANQLCIEPQLIVNAPQQVQNKGNQEKEQEKTKTKTKTKAATEATAQKSQKSSKKKK